MLFLKKASSMLKSIDRYEVFFLLVDLCHYYVCQNSNSCIATTSTWLQIQVAVGSHIFPTDSYMNNMRPEPPEHYFVYFPCTRSNAVLHPIVGVNLHPIVRVNLLIPLKVVFHK